MSDELNTDDTRPKQRRAFAARLKSALSEKRKPRTWLARTAGISHTVLTRYFKGDQFPPLADMQKLADALEIPIEQLQFFVDNTDIEIDEAAPPSTAAEIFQIVAVSKGVNVVRMRVDYLVSLSTALEIGKLLNEDEMRHARLDQMKEDEHLDEVERAFTPRRPIQ